MSDKRTKYVLGTILTGIALLVGIAAALPSMTEFVTNEVSPVGMTGHVLVIAVDPDGSAHYAQGDNTILIAGLNVAGASFFGTSTKNFDQIQFSSDSAGLSNAAVTGLFTNTGLLTGAYAHTGDIGGADCATTTFTCETLTTASTTISGADTTHTQIVSVALGNSDGVFISWVDLGTTLPVTAGVTQVTVTYKISLT